MIDKQIPIILASASPRRSELLKQAGFSFTVVPSTTEETRTETSPGQLVEDLAFQKANDVYETVKGNYTDQDFMVIGADTIVYYDGEVLGKPADAQEAFDMLKLLSDRTHQVYTGLAIILRKANEKQVHLLHERTDVTFYPISDEELKDYIATGDPLDKAGAYGIQGTFAVHVKEIKGDYNNVVGLPIARLYQTLRQIT
ncbi:MAG: septum formation inhibitor Maf [Lachnospiraceae bacterium]|nr:septum formation inhibitor Maf [Lachnospiraceae bacterium]